MDAMPPFPALLLYLLLAGLPVTLVHEFGHAVVARRRLRGPVRVSIGTAGKIAEFRIGGIDASIKAWSNPTRISSDYTDIAGSRATGMDMILITLAGPAASALGAVIAG